MRSDPQATPEGWSARRGAVGAGDRAVAGREASVDLEAHGIGSRIHEAHLGVDALTTREVGRVGHGVRHIEARRNIARGDAVAEAILQRHAQQRQGLGPRACVADARAHGNGAAAPLVYDGAELAHVIGAQVVVERDVVVGAGEPHVAGAHPSPTYVSAEEIPDEARTAERSVFEAKAREEGKPPDVIDRIVEGQLTKWAKEVTLLEQEHVRSDRYEGKTIEDLRAELASKTGENVRIARFARFVVGETE